MRNNYDFIIVGQGLAGSILSYQLINEGYKIIVLDNNYLSSSTKVAAGIINPLVLKRFTQSWRVKEFIDFNKKYYPEVEKELKSHFYFPKTILKLIESEDEKQFWKSRSDINNNSEYMERELLNLDNYNQINHTNYVGGVVKQGAWINTEKLLNVYRNYLIDKRSFKKEYFNYQQISISKQKVVYKNIHAKNIIFCEGFKAIENPYFSYLPFSPVKGELLIIRSKKLNNKYILSKKIFILPLGDHLYKIGATYVWNDLSLKTGESQKNELINNLNKLIDNDYEVINHQVGIRPAVKDRRPLIGRHPKFNNVFIFNGLGSRGMIMAPLLAEKLTQSIKTDKPLEKEININRYKKLFKDTTL